MMRKLTCVAIAFLAISASAQSSARPGDQPFRVAAAAKSKANGLAGAVVSRIERLPGPGRDVVMAKVLDRFTPPGLSTDQVRIHSTSESTVAVGDGWLAEVRGTGEAVRFVNDAYISGAANPRKSKAERTSGAVLEARGRQLIADTLAPFVKLGPGETIEAWSVSYMMESSANASGILEESVVASRILFTRVIDGVPVLGPGNKVSVTLANDGTLVGFDLDWPDLARVGQGAPLLDIGTIRAAVARQESPQAAAAENVFECGYFDKGVAGDVGLLQPACVSIVKAAPGQQMQVVVPATQQ